MPYLEVRDGTRLFYNDWGTGRPVVLVSGWPLSADMWEYQSLALASQGARVISYDRRGFGRSEQPWTGYEYNTLTDDLAVLLDKLNVTDAVLVGFSMGGGEVARYLARNGNARVSKAVLVSAVTPFLLKTPDNETGVDATVFDEMIANIHKDRPAFLATFNKQFFGAGLLNFSVSNELLRWAETVGMQASPKATIDCVRAFSATDFRADVQAIRVPTLLIHGDSDATVPIASSARLAAKLIPGARLEEYAGAPHGLFFTEKDRLAADLLTFARR